MKATIGRVEKCQGRQATPRYTLRLARTREEVEADLRLRFEAFNLELREGFAGIFFHWHRRGRIRSRLRTSHCH